jgi:hypothetical protein
MKDAGTQAVSFDVSQLKTEEEQDALAELVESGLGILAGVLQVVEPSPSASPRETAAGLIDLWHRMGIPPGQLDQQVVLTPACGLAGATPAGARTEEASS